MERARRACLSLPEAYEQVAWGEPTFRVRKRMFALFARARTHHGAGRDALWMAAPTGVQPMLGRSHPERFFVPPYVGVRGWIGVDLAAVGDAELRELAVQAFCMFAPKKLQALVDG